MEYTLVDPIILYAQCMVWLLCRVECLVVCAAVLVQVAGVSGPNYIPCKEDDDLLSAFDKMMADSAQVGGRGRGGSGGEGKGGELLMW